jgi:uncharacterized membrane protein
MIRKLRFAALAIVILSFLPSLYFYPQMPERIASHWNARGQVDGYMARAWGAFLLPAVSLALLGLFWLIPLIDPLRRNIEKFRGQYEGFVLLFALFFGYLHLLTLLGNVGVKINLLAALSPAFGILLYYVGVLTEHAKPNWFIGIRTPWTLSNEIVWERTHCVGGKLFKLCAPLAALGVFFGEWELLLLMGPLLAATVYMIVYSYVEYQRVTRPTGE